jgi:hypothetical protein
MEGESPKEVTLGEKALNWAKVLGILLPVLGAALVSVLGYFKSDDAQGGVDDLVKQLDKRVAKQEKVINAQSEQLEKMARRLIFFQAHQEGVSAGKLYAKNEQLEKLLVELKAKKIARSARAEKIIEILRGARVGTRKLRPPPKPPVQRTLPRIKSTPFSRKGAK